MPAAPFPPDEAQRLQALRELEILDSGDDAEFDALVRAAAAVCDAPVSLLSLVDEDRQWFKAALGAGEMRQTPRDVAFCAHTIHDDDILEVPDAVQDARFADNALVLGEPKIRFYAGAPLRLPNGLRVGTLCVIDRKPRVLDARQREILKHLADAAVIGMQRRREARDRALADAVNVNMARQLAQESIRKNNFLAALAHELRGPLGAMTTGMHLIGFSKEQANLKTHDMLRRQIKQMASLVDGLLDVSRISQGKVDIGHEPVDLNQVVTNAVETCLPMIESKQHEVVFLLSQEPLMVSGDFARLVQVCTNLITNAAKYTQAYGRITVSTLRSETHAHIEVADNGVGIEKAALERVFMIFEQIETSHALSQGGLGIGLSLVRQLTELHGGTVEVQSDGIGHGSRFTVKLPLIS